MGECHGVRTSLETISPPSCRELELAWTAYGVARLNKNNNFLAGDQRMTRVGKEPRGFSFTNTWYKDLIPR